MNEKCECTLLNFELCLASHRPSRFLATSQPVNLFIKSLLSFLNFYFICSSLFSGIALFRATSVNVLIKWFKIVAIVISRLWYAPGARSNACLTSFWLVLRFACWSNCLRAHPASDAASRVCSARGRCNSKGCFENSFSQPFSTGTFFEEAKQL